VRASSDKVRQRAVAEARANRNTVDVVEPTARNGVAAPRKGVQQVKSPHLADIIAPAIALTARWVGTRLNVFVQPYNTNA